MNRETSRTFVVAPGFPVIVAICPDETNAAQTRIEFQKEREQGRIVLLLSKDFTPEFNTNHIALADEVFIINSDGQYSDFQAAIVMSAKALDKPIRVLN